MRREKLLNCNKSFYYSIKRKNKAHLKKIFNASLEFDYLIKEMEQNLLLYPMSIKFHLGDRSQEF